ncbi:MAG TPA: hypothetical protein VK067_08635 [Pseudogracilibacillus sp.]|nr:hypothetical protein [Pseudogracilibacillus sp.]
MFTIRQLLLFGHILFAMMWVGGIVFVGWGVFPVMKKLAIHTQRTFLTNFMKHTHRLFTMLGFFVIVTGLLLATVFGPMSSLEQMMQTAYGQKVLFALGLAIFALLWGILFGYRHTRHMLKDDLAWEEAAAGNMQLLDRSFRKIMMIEAVEVLCFFILLYTMILF